MFSTLMMLYTFPKPLHYPMKPGCSYRKDVSHFPLPCCQMVMTTTTTKWALRKSENVAHLNAWHLFKDQLTSSTVPIVAVLIDVVDRKISLLHVNQPLKLSPSQIPLLIIVLHFIGSLVHCGYKPVLGGYLNLEYQSNQNMKSKQYESPTKCGKKI